MILRPYQERAIERVREEFVNGKRRVLLVIATGGGKTFTSSIIILKAIAKGKRCIFLAHRKELINQCSDTLKSLGVDHGVIRRGDSRQDTTKLVQVASIQTLIKRKHWEADLIVIDEAHRSCAKTYRDIIGRYDDSVLILGLTATPYRMDGKPLGEIYDSLVEVVETQELIDGGYLISPAVYGAEGPNLSDVNVGSGGDFNRGQLAESMAPAIIRGEILTNWAKICGGAIGADTRFAIGEDGREIVIETTCDACTVIFAPTVEKSKEIIDQFKAAGVKAAHLDGSMKNSERDSILKNLASGAISVVSNVDILTEGWDLPRLECIVAARPTRSKSLCRQMGGRIMRPDDDSRIKYIIDHADWTRMHGFLREPTIHSLTVAEKRPRKNGKKSVAPFKECPKCMTVHPIGCSECSECGYEWPAKEYEFTDEDLIHLDASMVARADVVPQSERQAAFDKLATACVEKGYKPNWARVRYQSAFGEWPSKANGLSTPSFFFRYEKKVNKALRSQMIAQAVADSATA